MSAMWRWGGEEMLNTITAFEKLMQEHEVIEANIKQIANAADNLLTLSSLRDEPDNFTDYQVNYLSDRRVNLKRAIGTLRDGLEDHQTREQEVIQPLVGDPIINAIKMQHQEALDLIADINWILLNVSPVGILFNCVFLKQKVDALCRTLNANTVRENSILELLSK
jgi:hypothetical protein